MALILDPCADPGWSLVYDLCSYVHLILKISMMHGRNENFKCLKNEFHKPRKNRFDKCQILLSVNITSMTPMGSLVITHSINQ